MRKKIKNKEDEIKRYETAKKQAIQQLREIYKKAVKEVGEIHAEIFEVHIMMLEDDDYNDSICNIITSQEVNAEYAVGITGDNFAEMFTNMEDDYLKARCADVKDISERVISILSGNNSDSGLGDEPVIIAAEDLAPSETVQMDKAKLLAFVTKAGSSNSHTAILARTMGIPALIGIDIETEWNGRMGIIDGYSGNLIVDPDEETMAEYQLKKEQDIKRKELLQTLMSKK